MPSSAPVTRSVACLALFLIAGFETAVPIALEAQSPGGIREVALIKWFKGARLERIRDGFVARCGLAFTMNRSAEQRFRAEGASDDWVTMLNAAPQFRTVQPGCEGDDRKDRTSDNALTPRELLPLYFLRSERVEIFVSAARLSETGGKVAGQRIQTPSGTIELQSVPIAPTVVTYGIIFGAPSKALEFEGYFQQPNFMMLHLGIAFNAFLPLGTTGVRGIAGITPFIGDTRQIVGHVERAVGDTAYNAVELHNAVYGGDVRIGLAYHWRPGGYVYAESGYRAAATARRQLELPGGQKITDGLNWSSWSANGGIFRIGLGF